MPNGNQISLRQGSTSIRTMNQSLTARKALRKEAGLRTGRFRPQCRIFFLVGTGIRTAGCSPLILLLPWAKIMWTRMESSSFMPDGTARKVRSAIFPVQAEITVHRRSLTNENMRLMRPASCCLLTILSGKIILYLQTRV